MVGVPVALLRVRQLPAVDLNASLLPPLAGLQRTLARDGVAVAAGNRDTSSYALLDGFELLRADAAAAGTTVFGSADHVARIDSYGTGRAALESCQTESERKVML